MRSLFFIIISCIACILGGCGGGANSDDSPTVTIDPVSTATTLEFKIIERYADLNAPQTFLEGIWESDCLPNGDSSYRKETYAFHLDGVYIDKPIYNDSACRVKNSRVHEIFYGVINNIEDKLLNNGIENITVAQVTFELRNEIVNRRLALDDIYWDKLTNSQLSTRVFKIVANRLYNTNNSSSPDSYSLLNDQFLRNNEIDISELTEVEIDIKAEELFGVL